jgi:hypothetical protein
MAHIERTTMKCAYCGNEITGTDHVQYEGLSFCNSIHRYSYKNEVTAAGKAAPPPPQAPSSNIWNIIGAAAGLAMGYYAGIHTLVPFILMIGVIWVLNTTNTVPTEGRTIIALLAAQFGWMFLGAVLTGQWNLVYIDLVFVGIGLVWLVVRLHAVPVIILLLFQLGVLILNVNLILQAEFGSDDHRALVVHIVLRVMLIAALGNGLLALRKRARF